MKNDMHNNPLLMLAILAAAVLITLGTIGYMLSTQPDTGGDSGYTVDGGHPGEGGSLLGPFTSNNPDVGQPPSPG